MNHSHQFIQIDTVSKSAHTPSPSDNNTSSAGVVIHRQLFGVKAMCALCGQIRHLWPDGKVEIVIHGTEELTQK